MIRIFERCVIRLIALMCFLSSVEMMTAQVMSLEECVSMAMLSNRRIQSANHLVNQYDQTQKALYANFFPNINLMASDFYSTLHGSATLDVATSAGNYAAQRAQELLPRMIDEGMRKKMAQGVTKALSPMNPELDYKMKNVFSAGVLLTQPLYMGGKISTAYRMGRIGVMMATQAQKQTREQVIVDVYEAYQQLVKAKELEVVAHQYDSLLTQIEHDVKSAVKHGMASHNDEMKVVVKKSDAELKIRQAENGIRLARMNLCQLIGKPFNSQIDPVPGEDDDFLEMIDDCATVNDRTEYKLLHLKQQLADEKVRLEKSAYMPQLGLVFNVGMLDGGEFLGEKLFNHRLNMAVGAMLRVPLFHANETRHKVAASKEEALRERLQGEELTDMMNLDLMQQANNVDEARLELELRKRNLEQCEENLHISRCAYSVGMETLSDLLTAQVLWQQAYADLVESRYQAKVKMMKWRRSAGRI